MNVGLGFGFFFCSRALLFTAFGPLYLELYGGNQLFVSCSFSFFDVLMVTVYAVDSRTRSSRGYINLLRLVWLLVLLYGEIYIFWNAATHCAPWPGKRQHLSSVSSHDDRLI